MRRSNGPRRLLAVALSLVVSAPIGLALVTPSLVEAQVSLATVVDLAQRNSSAVKLADADVSRAQAVLNQTHDAYIPNFAIGSTVGYSHGFPTGQPSVGSASMQSLVLSYSQRQYIKAAHAGLDAANLSLKDAREQVALDASTAYIELDTVNRELAAAEQQRLSRRICFGLSSSATRPASIQT
jgi:outer membrane protein TolC